MRRTPSANLLALGLLIAPLGAQDDQDFQRQIDGKAEKLAYEQDELSADVMEMVEEQTVPQVIELLEEVEVIMAEVTDDLIESETGGPTIAAQTEIIEKIFEAAKQRQQSSSGEGSEESQENMGAMLEMMQRMMGQAPSGPPQGQGQGQGQEPGEQAGEAGGQGQTGESNKGNEAVDGASQGDTEPRTVPKGTGAAGRNLPGEFRDLLDAYNRSSQ
ncbi:MAG: hypothetical protein Q7Q71_01805 [Verrucomicrobiota bacterium JB023]|nr:hypothetical protein [Verrucomicrobiota bacterium JB023]